MKQTVIMTIEIDEDTSLMISEYQQITGYSTSEVITCALQSLTQQMQKHIEDNLLPQYSK